MILNSCCLAEKLQNVKKKNVFLFLAGGKINRPGQLAPRGEDNQGGGQDIPGQLAPRGASQPRLACPPGVKLSRGQDKLGHRSEAVVLFLCYWCQFW